jgi:hypothetical protein
MCLRSVHKRRNARPGAPRSWDEAVSRCRHCAIRRATLASKARERRVSQRFPTTAPACSFARPRRSSAAHFNTACTAHTPVPRCQPCARPCAPAAMPDEGTVRASLVEALGAGASKVDGEVLDYVASCLADEARCAPQQPPAQAQAAAALRCAASRQRCSLTPALRRTWSGATAARARSRRWARC